MKGCWILRSFFMRHSVSTLVATSHQNELTTFLAQEDCSARSLVKGETQDEAEDVQAKKFGEEGLADGESDEEKNLDDDNSEERGSKNKASAKSVKKKGISEYAQRREKNIAENKKLLEELNAKYPMPEIKKKARTQRCVCFVIMMHDNV